MTEEHEEIMPATVNGEQVILDEEMDPITDDELLNFGVPKIVDITVSRLKVDPTVQRRLDHGRVNAMIAKFNPAAVGVVTINEREDSSIYLVDGQHRREMLIRSDREDFVVTANKYTGLTRAQEAYLFVLLNTTKHPTPVDLFRARLVAGHRATHEMYKLLTGLGWTITLQPGVGRFGAVRSLETLFHLDAEGTSRAVAILTEAFNRADGSMDYRLLSGLGRMIIRYGGRVDTKRMVKKLTEYPGGTAGLLSAASTFRATMRRRATDAMAFVLVGAYNHNTRTENQLPAWDATVG